MDSSESLSRRMTRPSSSRRSSAHRRAGEAAGFFHIYKKGQGYWTRMGTVGGAALIWRC